MSFTTFYIDGTEYTLPCSLERNVFKRQSDNAGYLMNGHYFNDVIATYARYTVKLTVPLGSENEYANLHDYLTDPAISEYTFTMPYNQDMITFKGMVNSLPDRFYTKQKKSGKNVNIWRGITFEITATEPIKEADAV